MLTYGPDAGKLAVVIDVVDTNKVLIDGPLTGVARQSIQVRAIALTDIVITISKGARAAQLTKAWKKGEVDAKWAKTSWAKKVASRAKRASLNDFSRFKVMIARKKVKFYLVYGSERERVCVCNVS
jgi:large subunit ribosomal protein L14e